LGWEISDERVTSHTISPNPSDTDGVIELSLRLAATARRRLPAKCRDEEDE
jgi:hypothetical protein